jgi:thymidylate synthase (FAD)
MNVKLVGVTAPYAGHNSAEDLIVHMARVSNPSNQGMNSDPARLIRYLIKNQHWSPFEMVNVVMEINTTRDIARQILRHRSFSFQEFSQRYADPTKDLGFELREARLQDTKNRQNSIETDDNELQSEWKTKQVNLIAEAKAAYDWAISNGIAKEQARVVLPEGNTQSRMYMNGTLRSWVHYCQLRMENGTQKEHAEVAAACWKIIAEKFPNVVAALEQ